MNATDFSLKTKKLTIGVKEKIAPNKIKSNKKEKKRSNGVRFVIVYALGVL